MKNKIYRLVKDGVVHGVYDFTNINDQIKARMDLRRMRGKEEVSELGETKVLHDMDRKGYRLTRSESARVEDFRNQILDWKRLA